jgi:hypothetical protein
LVEYRIRQIIPIGWVDMFIITPTLPVCRACAWCRAWEWEWGLGAGRVGLGRRQERVRPRGRASYVLDSSRAWAGEVVGDATWRAARVLLRRRPVARRTAGLGLGRLGLARLR